MVNKSPSLSPAVKPLKANHPEFCDNSTFVCDVVKSTCSVDGRIAGETLTRRIAVTNETLKIDPAVEILDFPSFFALAIVGWSHLFAGSCLASAGKVCLNA